MPFTIFDPNMNKIDYPVGVLPLDFLVSAIEKERYVENIKGIPGTVNYGFDYKEREVALNFWLRHYHGEYDQKLLKSELYAMLDSQPYFYISDDRLPTRVLKVAIDEPYLPDRINGSNISTLEVKCQIIGLPFWQTKYTSMYFEEQGFDAMVERFGLADGINTNYPKYIFNDNTFYVWNGGNVDIDPRYMTLYIRLKNVKSSGDLTIENLTTNEKFIYKPSVDDAHIDLYGTKILMGASNKLRDSNRKFIGLKVGLNKIKISNATHEGALFTFPFYFK